MTAGQPFSPTIQQVKDIIEDFICDGKPVTCTYDQAEQVLNNWLYQVQHEFYDFVKGEYMEGDIFNIDE